MRIFEISIKNFTVRKESREAGGGKKNGIKKFSATGYLLGKPWRRGGRRLNTNAKVMSGVSVPSLVLATESRGPR